MAFNALKSFLNINNSSKNAECIVGEPYDFQTNISVKVDTQTNRLVGLPPEWADIFEKNAIDSIMDTDKLKPIIRAYERSLRIYERKGLPFSKKFSLNLFFSIDLSFKLSFLSKKVLKPSQLLRMKSQTMCHQTSTFLFFGPKINPVFPFQFSNCSLQYLAYKILKQYFYLL